MFPSSGNPNGFPKAWTAGLCWEFHTETDSGLHLTLDTTSYSEPRFRAGYLKGVHAYDFSWSQSAVRFDQWVPFSIDVKWSYGSDGFTKVVIGSETLVNRTGPSLPSGQSPKLQFGYYANRQLRNEVWFAGVRRG
jgi:hypothetical protein